MSGEIKTNIAVSGIIFKKGRFLLLKRVNPPFIWCPPGGRVRRNEDPINAVKREINEEAGLKVKVLMPIAVWHGQHGQSNLYAIDFLCQYSSGKIVLSKEHSQGSWLTLTELNYLKVTHNFKVFKIAKKLFNCIK